MSQTVFEQLIQEYPDVSKQSIRKWLKHGRVLINQKIVKRGDIFLSAEDVLEINRKKTHSLPFEILFQDSSIIVVEKPPHLLSVASLDPKEPSVHKYLKKHFSSQNIAPLHRLDKEVAGPLVFVKDPKHFDLFKNLFIQRKIQREYHAIVEKPFSVQKGIIRSYLREGAGYKMQSSDNPHEGKEAITHFEVISQNNEFAWIKLQLETGRKNQIRIHLASNGHPILGDIKYGGMLLGPKGIALYAHSLKFTHPMTQKEMVFSSKPTAAFNKLLRKASLFTPNAIGNKLNSRLG